MLNQTTINTTNAAADLARMNAEGWRLIAVGNGQWAGGSPSSIGLTMFFEKDAVAEIVLPPPAQAGQTIQIQGPAKVTARSKK